MGVTDFKTAAILVGGKSTRMGLDKKNLVLGEEGLLQSIVHQLSPLFEDIIALGCPREAVAPVTGIRAFYPDALATAASLTGIYTGLCHTESRYLYVTACDMPHYNPRYIRYMMSRLKEDPTSGCVTRYQEWIEPFNAFYSPALLPTMEAFLNSRRKSIFKYLEGESITYIPEATARRFSPNWEMFCNLNTPRDLATHLGGPHDHLS